MSSPRETLLPEYIRFSGVMYHFEETGDCLPWHTHGPESAHVMIVARGSVKLESGKRAGIAERTDELKEGAFVDIPANLFHQVTATRGNTRIFNIRKGE